MITVTNIKTDEEAFFHIRDHLLTQKVRSINESEDCAYRGISREDYDKLDTAAFQYASSLNHDNEDEDGIEIYDDYQIRDDYRLNHFHDYPQKYCAIGIIVADEFYTSEMENNSVSDDLVQMVIIKSNPNWQIDRNSIDLLNNLQEVHDRVHSERWEKDLDPDFWNFDNTGKFLGRKERYGL